MKHFRLLLLLACSLAGVTTSRAQVNVAISIKERFHIVHESIIATVTLSNLAGRDITLSDTPQYQWFSFRITADGDRAVPPRDLHYQLPPVTIQAGETVKRSVDLTQLYDLGSFGSYRIQANVYYDGLDKFFASKPTFVDITEGRVIGRQVAGVPEGMPGAGQMHTFTLLAHQRGEVNTLYVRVEDRDQGLVYCTIPIGRLLDEVPPQAAFDASNNFYVLQLVGNRSYTLTKITPNGQFAGQTNYSAPKSRPMLRKTNDGTLQIVGGQREGLAQNPDPGTATAPKLSDRPAGLPSR